MQKEVFSWYQKRKSGDLRGMRVRSGRTLRTKTCAVCGMTVFDWCLGGFQSGCVWKGGTRCPTLKLSILNLVCVYIYTHIYIYTYAVWSIYMRWNSLCVWRLCQDLNPLSASRPTNGCGHCSYRSLAPHLPAQRKGVWCAFSSVIPSSGRMWFQTLIKFVLTNNVGLLGQPVCLVKLSYSCVLFSFD